ncbi:hypothetical protein KFK09_014183 [Dendrobium nobile]|uniref:Uncharacterized protein n=1 Tax=Dendrobium nobile TaxID=94219 RepID=A0A8T3BEY8_DENNO|nr:hypothetical protein KFK09_014183 [Dendrobium nobile]
MKPFVSCRGEAGLGIFGGTPAACALQEHGKERESHRLTYLVRSSQTKQEEGESGRRGVQRFSSVVRPSQVKQEGESRRREAELRPSCVRPYLAVDLILRSNQSSRREEEGQPNPHVFPCCCFLLSWTKRGKYLYVFLHSSK